MTKLQNKVAVITGASQGIGLAIYKEFVHQGIEHLFVTGRQQTFLDEIQTNITKVKCDISKLTDLDNLVNRIVEKKCQLDIIVANAGISLLVPLQSITEQQYQQTFDVNVKGTLFTIQKLLPLLNDGGSIIIIGSVSSQKAHPNASLYSASKAAIRAFARCLTIKLKQRHIRVNVLSPGSIQTSMFTSIVQHQLSKDTFLEDILSTIPLNRLGTPEEVAKVAVFLASDESCFINGIELFVDGGRGQI